LVKTDVSDVDAGLWMEHQFCGLATTRAV